MSKTRKKLAKSNTRFDDEGEGYTRRDLQRDRERKSQKRLNRALKTKNLDDLVDEDDEDDWVDPYEFQEK